MSQATIAARLAADLVIADIVDQRIYVHDIRTSGGEAIPDVQDQYGDVRTFLMVLDGGELKLIDPFVTSDVYQVTCIGPRTTAGRQAVRDVITRSRALLDGWQDPLSGAMFSFGGRLGHLVDNAFDQSVMDRLTIQGTRVPERVYF